MNARILEYWEHLRASFWFVPSLMAAAAAMLAIGAVATDRQVTLHWLQSQAWAYTGGAEGASLVLSTIAGSMITIAGVVFSMTLVALSLASSQLGPRLLRSFMRDRVNQGVLGTFIATFVYCLLVLRTIRHGDEQGFVPHLSVTLGVLFALTSLGVLIYFIHHVAVTIQADEVVDRIGGELTVAIDRQYESKGKPTQPEPRHVRPETAMPPDFDVSASAIEAARDGYVQIVDIRALVQLAQKADVLLRLERRPGHYVIKGRPIATLLPADGGTEALVAQVSAAIVIGGCRTPTQDIEFAVHQLVEIAVRALSPGINDPFTAIACIDRLGSALHHLAQRPMPSPNHVDEAGQLRLVVPGPSFGDVVDAAFNQIRQSGHAHAAVSIRLLETIAAIGMGVPSEADRAVLRRHAGMIARDTLAALPNREDREAVTARLATALYETRENLPPDRHRLM